MARRRLPAHSVKGKTQLIPPLRRSRSCKRTSRRRNPVSWYEPREFSRRAEETIAARAVLRRENVDGSGIPSHSFKKPLRRPTTTHGEIDSLVRHEPDYPAGAP